MLPGGVCTSPRIHEQVTAPTRDGDDSADEGGESDDKQSDSSDKMDVAKLRTWTASNGKSTIEARLIRQPDNPVVLRRANGTEITVPLPKLSQPTRPMCAN